ncbi:MAG: RHS repeat domain-containing protein [Candidatus Roizmanbacteria bacterium]
MTRYFVFQGKTRSIAHDNTSETEKIAFVPDKFDAKVKEPLKTDVRTLTVNQEYDILGNLVRSASLGEVDENDKDLKADDNRYSYTYYLTNTPNWIKGLPYLSYTSNKDGCEIKDLSCQWGRKEMWYDIFDKVGGKDYDAFISADDRANLVKFGLPTQTEAYLSDKADEKVISGMTYTTTSTDESMPKFAGVYQTFAPKPNIKKPTKADLIKVSQVTYDDYYHSLVTQKENNLGHKEKYSDYDVLLQVPKVVKKQTQKSPERYAVTTMSFDDFGRLIATYAPDPEQPEEAGNPLFPGKSLLLPATLTHYFMPEYARLIPDNAKNSKGDKAPVSLTGMVTRTMALSSQTKDSKFHYSASDSFYDGLGNVIQAQNLSSAIDGVDKRTVQNSQFNADGTTDVTYQVEVRDPVVLDDISSIDKVAPSYVTVEDPKIISQTQYDSQRRPIVQKTIDPVEKTTFTSSTAYLLNATRTTDQKGVVSIAVADTLGRNLYGLTYHPDAKESMITSNLYEKEMVDKPTATTMEDQDGKKVITKASYDRAGRTESSNEPSFGSTKFQYDALGNILVQSNAPREQIELTYDTLGRVTEKHYQKSGSQPLYKKLFTENKDSIIFTYDEGQNTLGKLAKVSDLSGSESYTYDGGQRITDTKKTIETVARTFSSKYNKISQVTTSSYPDSTKVDYEYDKYGVAQKVLINGLAAVNGVKFDKYGNTTDTSVSFAGKTYNNTTKYDDLGRIKNLSVGESPTNSLLDQQLHYNQKGEIDTLSEKINGKNNTYAYGYDNFSQLLGVKSNLYTSSYSYDSFGRIQMKDEKEKVDYVYDDSFPFFAPKAVAITPKLEVGDIGTTIPVGNISPVPLPSGKIGLPIPLPSNPQTKVPAKTAVLGEQAGIPIAYTERGAMTQDQESCYTYNIEGQLIELLVKKTQDEKCGLERNQYKRAFAFYYDHAGTLVMQEIYDTPDSSKPSKKTYFFGDYEEEVN